MQLRPLEHIQHGFFPLYPLNLASPLFAPVLSPGLIDRTRFITVSAGINLNSRAFFVHFSFSSLSPQVLEKKRNHPKKTVAAKSPWLFQRHRNEIHFNGTWSIPWGGAEKSVSVFVGQDETHRSFLEMSATSFGFATLKFILLFSLIVLIVITAAQGLFFPL